ncbi:MAG: cbb3-type cytochrome oxidase assembly protein CcoS [Burkholderiaceae bacterium]
MSIVPAMILLSLLVVGGAVLAFVWAVEHDQFDDLQGPAFLPLDDAEPVGPAALLTPAAPTTLSATTSTSVSVSAPVSIPATHSPSETPPPDPRMPA